MCGFLKIKLLFGLIKALIAPLSTAHSATDDPHKNCETVIKSHSVLVCSIHLKMAWPAQQTRIEKNYSSEQREHWKKSPHSQSVSHEAGRVGTFLGQKYNEVIYTGAGCVLGKVLCVVLNSQLVVWVGHNLTLQKNSVMQSFARHISLPTNEFWVYYVCVFFSV